MDKFAKRLSVIALSGLLSLGSCKDKVIDTASKNEEPVKQEQVDKQQENMKTDRQRDESYLDLPEMKEFERITYEDRVKKVILESENGVESDTIKVKAIRADKFNIGDRVFKVTSDTFADKNENNKKDSGEVIQENKVQYFDENHVPDDLEVVGKMPSEFEKATPVLISIKNVEPFFVKNKSKRSYLKKSF